MILSCQNVSKAFSEKSILKDISFHIEDYDNAAIVGINGVGKTTSIAKIANYFVKNHKKVLLVAGDTFRAGAIEQLKA